MAYITPDTTVYLLRDIKLDPSYANTIYFTTSTAQYTYFVSKYKHHLTAQTYQRINKNVIRVQKTEAEVMDCCYMMFRNTAYKDKWFYAFITGTEYVNDVTTNIYYEIDIVQTWLFEMTVHPCMIDRTHIPTSEDTVGANITPEPVNLGEMVHSHQNVLINLHDSVVAIQVILDTPQPALSMGGPYDGVYNGAKIWVKNIRYDSGGSVIGSDLLAIYNYLANFTTKPDNVLGMYIIPRYCIPDISDSALNDGAYLPFNGGRNIRELTGKVCSPTQDTFGSYGVAKNKKLYTYPYNYQEFFTSDGQTMKIRYEFCKNLQTKLAVSTSTTTPVQIVARPIDYKGIDSGSAAGSKYIYSDYEEHINITNFPLCSWSNDYYASWVAQNGLPMALGAVATAAGMYKMGTSFTGEAVLSPEGEVTQSKIKHFMDLDPQNPKHQKWFDEIPQRTYSNNEVLAEGLPNIASSLQQSYAASIHSDNFRGTLNTGNADFSTKCMNIYQRRTCVNAEYAKMIDQFFELYGYSVGEIRTVDRNVRPYWTYVKTKDCVITGRCPMSAIKFVESLYNRGMRWWSNGDNIGNYLNLDNHS